MFLASAKSIAVFPPTEESTAESKVAFLFPGQTLFKNWKKICAEKNFAIGLSDILGANIRNNSFRLYQT